MVFHTFRLFPKNTVSSWTKLIFLCLLVSFANFVSRWFFWRNTYGLWKPIWFHYFSRIWFESPMGYRSRMNPRISSLSMLTGIAVVFSELNSFRNIQKRHWRLLPLSVVIVITVVEILIKEHSFLFRTSEVCDLSRWWNWAYLRRMLTATITWIHTIVFQKNDILFWLHCLKDLLFGVLNKSSCFVIKRQSSVNLLELFNLLLHPPSNSHCLYIWSCTSSSYRWTASSLACFCLSLSCF